MNGYIFFDELQENSLFYAFDAGESVVIPARTRYNLVRDRETGEDKGLVIYNGSFPKSYFRHRNHSCWLFDKTSFNSPTRAYFCIPKEDARRLGEDLKNKLDKDSNGAR
jgi:hypothetical protein